MPEENLSSEGDYVKVVDKLAKQPTTMTPVEITGEGREPDKAGSAVPANKVE